MSAAPTCSGETACLQTACLRTACLQTVCLQTACWLTAPSYLCEQVSDAVVLHAAPLVSEVATVAVTVALWLYQRLVARPSLCSPTHRRRKVMCLLETREALQPPPELAQTAASQPGMSQQAPALAALARVWRRLHVLFRLARCATAPPHDA